MLEVDRTEHPAKDRIAIGRWAVRDVLVNLSVEEWRDVAADYAISVAEAFGAHLTGLAFAYELALEPAFAGSVPVDLLTALHVERTDAANRAIARFEDAARRAGISAEGRLVSATVPGASVQLGHIARRFDLSVVAQPEPDEAVPGDLMVEAALFESGRPVLVVPYIQREGLRLGRVLVCWDASRTAARAVADAMPLLARAKAVELVMVASEPAKSDEIPGADIAHHLARHGLTVELKRISAGELDAANAILSHAADSSADLIVMGGYGHSRLREFVLGGATRGILASMTVPTFMSH